jgi:hypothetical protein
MPAFVTVVVRYASGRRNGPLLRSRMMNAWRSSSRAPTARWDGQLEDREAAEHARLARQFVRQTRKARTVVVRRQLERLSQHRRLPAGIASDRLVPEQVLGFLLVEAAVGTAGRWC